LLFRRYKDVARLHGIYAESIDVTPDTPRLSCTLWPNLNWEWVINTTLANTIQHKWTVERRPSFQLLHSDEISKCRSLLKSYLPDVEGFGTVHIRQPAYRSEASSYFRNSQPIPYWQSIYQTLTSPSTCINLGSAYDKRVPKEFASKIFDYAKSPLKSELMDIYLVQQTSWHVGTPSGLDHLPAIFGAPTIILDQYVLTYPITHNTLYAPRVLLKDSKIYSYQLFYREHPWIHFTDLELMRLLSIDSRRLGLAEMNPIIRDFIHSCNDSNNIKLSLPTMISSRLILSLGDQGGDHTINISTQYLQMFPFSILQPAS